MVDMDSPNRSPVAANTPNATPTGSTNNTNLSIATCVVLSLLGGFIGFSGYFVALSLLDSRSQTSGPTLSYGQQAALFSLPICTIMGNVIGFSVALSVARKYLRAIAFLLGAGLYATAVVILLWNIQIAQYGRDPSEIVLYYPPLTAALSALIVSVLVGLVAVIDHLRERLFVTRP